MENERIIEQLTAAFEAHGYFVNCQPIEGLETVFIASLREGFAKVEQIVAFNAKRYGYRGLSSNALSHLHSVLPEPTWGVTV